MDFLLEEHSQETMRDLVEMRGTQFMKAILDADGRHGPARRTRGKLQRRFQLGNDESDEECDVQYRCHNDHEAGTSGTANHPMDV
jgi:hypothetical protein